MDYKVVVTRNAEENLENFIKYFSGVKKNQLPDDVKADLKEFYHWNKK